MFDLFIILKNKHKESLFVTTTTISSSWKTFLGVGCVTLVNTGTDDLGYQYERLCFGSL